MKRVVIIGAGGNGREVAEILRHRAQTKGDGLEPLGFVDDNPDLRGRILDDLPVLGDWSWFEGVDRSEVAVICSSGFSEPRQRMAERARGLGLSFANAISPLTYISPNAKLGEGLIICQNVVVERGTLIGDHSLINVGSVVGHDAVLGTYATINPGVNVAGGVTIGEGCYLGIGCSVIQGISIGAWTVVGANAAVIRDLPGGVTAVGVPAKIIKTREKAE